MAHKDDPREHVLRQRQNAILDTGKIALLV